MVRLPSGRNVTVTGSGYFEQKAHTVPATRGTSADGDGALSAAFAELAAGADDTPGGRSTMGASTALGTAHAAQRTRSKDARTTAA
jgi:hypothetical protein